MAWGFLRRLFACFILGGGVVFSGFFSMHGLKKGYGYDVRRGHWTRRLGNLLTFISAKDIRPRNLWLTIHSYEFLVSDAFLCILTRVNRLSIPN